MKAPVDKATTARVLADIADAVRPVDMARTAAAVERVLATMSSGELCNGPFDDCECWNGETERDDATPGLVRQCTCDGEDYCELSAAIDRQRERYAPWVVSPHLFEAVDQ